MNELTALALHIARLEMALRQLEEALAAKQAECEQLQTPKKRVAKKVDKEVK